MNVQRSKNQLTRHSLACVGVALQRFIAVHTQALVGAVGVDAALAAGETGGALVDIHASLPIVLQAETGPALTLITEGEKVKSHDLI